MKRGRALSHLDFWATSVVTAQVDADIADLDKNFWQLAASLAKAHPDIAGVLFGLSTTVIEALAAAQHPEKILSNGVLLAFAPVFDESSFDRSYSAAAQGNSTIHTSREVDVAYWQTVVRIAEKRDPLAASIVFGIPRDVVAKIAALGFIGARDFARNFSASWTLRCQPNAVLRALELNNSKDSESATSFSDALILRIAQSLSHHNHRFLIR